MGGGEKNDDGFRWYDTNKMAPRGNEGLDFTPILTHYLFLFTTVLSVVRTPLPLPDLHPHHPR